MACNSIAPVRGGCNPGFAGSTADAQPSGGKLKQDAIRQYATDNNIPADELVNALTDLQKALARKPPDAGEIKKVIAELATLLGINSADNGAPVGQASGATAPAQAVQDALRALGIPPDIIDRMVPDNTNGAPQMAPATSFLKSAPADTAGNTTPDTGPVGNPGSGGNGSIAALTQHVNGILADGRDHGFQNGIDSYVPRIQEAMRHLQQAGIVTSKDPFEAMQQTAKWLMSNAGSDGVFSFGGGPANEDDAAALSARSGISRGDINAAKFMFDNFHDAELSQKDSFLTVDRNNPVFQDLAGVLSSAGLFEHR